MTEEKGGLGSELVNWKRRGKKGRVKNGKVGKEIKLVATLYTSDFNINHRIRLPELLPSFAKIGLLSLNQQSSKTICF